MLWRLSTFLEKAFNVAKLALPVGDGTFCNCVHHGGSRVVNVKDSADSVANARSWHKLD